MLSKLKLALLCASMLAAAAPGFIAQAAASVPALPATSPLITGAIDETSLATLTGNHPGVITRVQDQGALDADHVLPHVTIGLKRPAALQAAFDRLVAEQTRPGSANYQNWLTAADLRRFGPAQSDIGRVVAWLQSHNLTVNSISPSGMSIDAAGRVQDFAAAFHTSLHHVSLNGAAHIANMADPAIPAALAPVLRGVTLSNFFPRPDIVPVRPSFSVPPLNDFPAYYFVAPADFAIIYNLNPVFDGIGTPFGGYDTGSGVTIAVIEDSDVRARDVTRFRDYFGLNKYTSTLTLEHPGACDDPGYNADENEAAVDAEWAGASAPSANIIEASCNGSELTLGIETALQSLVELAQTPATIYSISFSAPEDLNGTAFLSGWENLIEEGASQGISIMISAGDSGPGADHSTNYNGLSVNGLGSNEYDTVVGGTDFVDYAHGQTSTYWAKANKGPGFASVKSYVPEMPWDDSCANSILANFEAKTTGIAYCNGATVDTIMNGSGGSSGQSVIYAKPDWQLTTILGMPIDGARDLPDISLFAGDGFWNHSYLYCMSDSNQGGAPCKYTGNISGVPWSVFSAAGGTSFGTPAFAGIMALVSAANNGRRLGNVAPRLYQLAATQYANPLTVSRCNASLGNAISTQCVFYNTTAGDNAQPCYAGTLNCFVNKSSTNGIGVLSASTGKPEVNAFPAHPGYNLATGLGSLNVTNLVINY